MKIWRKGVHTSPIDIYSKEKDPIKEKNIFWAPVFSIALSHFFSGLDYGKGVKEILYRNFCLKEGYNDKLLYYGSRKKIVDCAIVLDYNSVLNMNIDEYGSYLARLYMERSQQFSELKIKDFDVDKYIEELDVFFRRNNLLQATH